MHILLIEDDVRVSTWVIKGLSEAGHHVDAVADGREGLMLAMDGVHELLIVDRKLPRLDGLALVRALRAAGIRTPLIFLSALAEAEERVIGLEAGADDYLGKPFLFSELLARVAALGRRPIGTVESTTYQLADLKIDILSRTVHRAGDTIRLLPREFALLEVLMKNQGRVVTRTKLLEQVWGYNFDPSSSIIETYISRLRDKIDRPYSHELLHTVRGVGYSLSDELKLQRSAVTENGE